MSRNLFVCLLLLSAIATAELNVPASEALLQRIVPARAAEFRVETVPADGALDVYEIEAANGHIVLRGSSGVAVAMALREYLGKWCNASVTLWGSQLELPHPLPPVEEKVRVVVPLRDRYAFNYCCFSYSMAWWDWPEWECAIDWLALHGVNMPLAVTGQEGVWQAVYRNLGLSDADLEAFFVGPAYLPFGWMGCIDGWGGPLPQHWIDRHRELQQKILARERELGMRPVLQGFTGHVPKALQTHFPEARFQQLPSWCEFPPTSFVDPQDPLFQRIGQAFIEEQSREFGTDHLYAADTFIEMPPPSSDPAFLDAMGKAVYNGMSAADPEAVWVMQGWIFFNAAQFWQAPQTQALLGSVPHGRMLVLDLFCESNPVWNKTQAFYGHDWCWSIVQSFGHQTSLHGGLQQIAAGLVGAVHDPARGKLSGTGFLMEGLGHSPVVYELMADLISHPIDTDLSAWLVDFTRRRYGQSHPAAVASSTALLPLLFNSPNQLRSIVCARPKLEFTASGRPVLYPPYVFRQQDLDDAWRTLLEARAELGGKDTYAYDVVNIARQALACRAREPYNRMAKAYADGDAEALAAAGGELLDLITDLDTLVSTRPEFLLGEWLADARRWAATAEEAKLYEWNARNQITLWGPPEGILFDYAAKQWGGLLREFHRGRWALFLQ
ncbi:MAG: alpha-N-acetylglucosaminidase, partial [Candidatus Hydrogenedentes bacterium]|nr:alpha-N-acetylglucosaminidase [Candidatus Hydrogenedentota bacterium]